MPKTLRRASVILALSGLWLAAVWLIALFFLPLDETIPQTSGRVAEEQRTGLRVSPLLAAAFVHWILCVLVRTGLRSVRVVLTITSVVLGLVALLSTAFSVLEYQDLIERAAGRGRQMPLTGVTVSVIVVEVLGFVSTVIGVVLLYLPASNAYIEGVRSRRSRSRERMTEFLD
ncbi:hypothetical protein [Amycolatopsis rifamycinica]|uniref:Uncharacterized protein n=1 Tax=Amycolatopsis rifamycinica TaxID=287986 RepID=A0A066U7J7_9PSEU|nr:hypothetical protein [Amycolatopsis rifamycinica]KDN21832.1 hypothetical protein DV20_12945 [Amycolatopsis rifamycinica]